MLGRQAVATGALVGALTLAIAGCGGAEPEPAGPQLPDHAFEPAVPEGFFGVNGQLLRPLAENGELDVLDEQLAQVAAGGIDFIRANTDWPRIEPAPPSGEQHGYDLSGLDAWMGALAVHGVAWEPAVMGVPTPQWAVDPNAAKVCGLRAFPARAADLAALARALAERYGRDGSFWEENPELEYVPVTRYELWNEPNLGSFWCPIPDPEQFAEFADATADAILAVDSKATLILGGLAGFEQTAITAPATDAHFSSQEFLEQMLAASPGLARKIDVVGVHAYGAVPRGVLESVAYQRSAIRAAGLVDKPMSLNETGWYTAGVGATPPVPEEDRAVYLAEVTRAVALSRESCAIDSFAPHTWITPEANLGSIEDWYGIADPQTGEPYPSGQAYVDEVLLFEGRGDEPPPSGGDELCAR